MRRMVALGLLAALAAWPTAAAPADVPDGDPRVTPVVRAYRKVKPAVVNIVTEKIITARMGLMGDSFFDDIFPSPFVRRVPVHSLGSGFVIHPSGYLVTNAHVVRRAEKIDVVFQDEAKYPAKVISAEERCDLAVLKIEANAPLPHLPLGRSDDLMVGETVIAIGNPFGYASTVSVGVISATGRNLEFGNGVEIASLIQTDAPINPGNSGGPLLNIKGELIGITTAIRANAQSIGFAIPVDTLAAETTRLLDFERLNRVVFGAAVEQKRGRGGPEVLVSGVRRGTPADGKLRKGDRLVSVDGAKVAQIPDFSCPMLAAKPGRKVRLGVLRGGRPADVEVTLEAKPRPDGRALGKTMLGVTLKPVTKQLAGDMGLPVERGLVVVGLDADGPAARIGVKLKDVLFQLGRMYVMDLDDLGMALEDVKGGQPVRIAIIRGRVRAWATIRTREQAASQPAKEPT
ncbi:MAG TPA: trypsin-like peptidase domain-containing protein [Phycisphaerae bacterium]|nr:trypsin-like peptidase domain-containing protein [Phycisphaerae bacterium]